MKTAIYFNRVTKSYQLFSNSKEKIKSFLFNNKNVKQHDALKDISLSIPMGEVVGIVGVNGSGKSTMSNMIAGVSLPTKGQVEINGSVALISIASGFNNHLSGLENIRMKGLMLGLTKEQIEKIIPEVIEFADIGEFIHQPMKTYSSGMKSRLGFAISIRVNPDILVIDEALSVGDQTFANKCLAEINKFKEQGKTIIFISHSLSQVRDFCEKVIWIHKGKLIQYGLANEVIAAYSKFIQQIKVSKDKSEVAIIEQELIEHAIEQQQILNQQNKGDRFRKKKVEKKSFKFLTFSVVFLSLSFIISGLYFMVGKDILKKMENDIITQEKPKEVLSKEEKKEEESIESISLSKDYVVVNQDEANIRSSNSTDSVRLMVANFGQGFELVSEDNSWYEVQLENEVGWIHNSVAEKIDKTTQLDYVTNKTIEEVLVLFDNEVILQDLINLLQQDEQSISTFMNDNSEDHNFSYEKRSDGVNQFHFRSSNNEIDEVKLLLEKGIIHNLEINKYLFASKDLLLILEETLEGIQLTLQLNTLLS